jgi:hypothetical protein
LGDPLNKALKFLGATEIELSHGAFLENTIFDLTETVPPHVSLCA